MYVHARSLLMLSWTSHSGGCASPGSDLLLAASNSEVPTSSKFEVSIAQPLPKLATATSYWLHLCFPPTEFKYYHEKSIDYYIIFV